MKTVSVVISNYNYAQYLPQTLDSVLAQSHPATQIIIVDDGSTDNSAQILKAYAQKHSIIRLVFQENGGQGRAMNAGISQSTGDVVLFMDSDDIWYPDKIKTVLPLLDRYGFVQHNLTCKDKLYRSFLISRDHRRYMLEFGMFDFFVPTSGLCLGRDIVEKVFPLPENDILRICADAYITRLALYYSPLATVHNSLGLYRIHGENNWTGSQNSKQDQDKIPNIIRLINKRLGERGEQTIPLERNWILYGEHASEIDHSFSVLKELKAQPDHSIPARALEGYLHLALGQYDEGVKDFQYVVDNWHVADHAHCMGQDMKNIVAIQGQSPACHDTSLTKVYHRLGQCLQVAGESNEALAALKAGINGTENAISNADGISPGELANTYYNMAVCFVRLKRYDDALEAFAKVLENAPERLEIYLNRSDSLRYLGRYDQALAEVDKAQAIDPDFPNLEETRLKVRRAMTHDRNRIGFNIQLQTTSICNGKCIMCPYLDSWQKNNPGMMTDKTFDRILNQIKPLPLDKICMYLENEPLVDPKILTRTEKVINELSFNLIEISTNAALMTKDKARMLGKLLNRIPHQIWISFHGVNPRTFEGIMGLDFEKTLDNVIYLLQLSQKTPLNITIRGSGEPLVKSIGHQYGFSEKEYRVFWSRQFETHHIKIEPKINYFRYHDRCGTIKRNDIRLEKNVRDSLTGFYCPRVDSWLHFLYTGELCICCMDYHREQVFGDITTHSIDDILKGESYRRMRDMAFGLKESPGNFICKRCISPNG